jgi:hypothetical protein
MPAKPPFVNTWIEGPPIIVEVYAALWSRASHFAERADLARRLERSLSALGKLDVTFPIARSRVALWKGRYAGMRGQRRREEWYLHQALNLSRRYRVPFDEALARQALAKIDHVRRAEHERIARMIFERLGAAWHLANFAQ